MLYKHSGWERGGKSVTPRKITFPQSCGNSITGRLLGIGAGAAPITMHQSKDLIELDSIELQTNPISEPGPAKWPSQDEKMTPWRHRKAPCCARRGQTPARSSVQLGRRAAEDGLKVCLEYVGSILRRPNPFSGVVGAHLLGVQRCSHTLLLHAGCRSGGPVPTQSTSTP